MKNLSPRQREILNLVTKNGDVAIEEIRQAIGISQATAYREVQTLVTMGLAAKIPGGISYIEVRKPGCVQCGQENNPRTTFIIEQTAGEKLAACCSHCGFMALSNRENMRSVMTSDFLYGTMLNARAAWFVVNSSITLCCEPSVLSFSKRDDAEHFARGFGGSALDFAGTQQQVGELMAL